VSYARESLRISRALERGAVRATNIPIREASVRAHASALRSSYGFSLKIVPQPLPLVQFVPPPSYVVP
jgi:hypothetical protein